MTPDFHTLINDADKLIEQSNADEATKDALDHLSCAIQDLAEQLEKIREALRGLGDDIDRS